MCWLVALRCVALRIYYSGSGLKIPVWWAGEKERKKVVASEERARNGGLTWRDVSVGVKMQKKLQFEEQRATTLQMSGPGEVEAPTQVLYMGGDIGARGKTTLI